MAKDATRTHRGLKIAHLNARSIVSKSDSLSLWLEEGKYDIVTINETWLSPDIPTSYLDIGGYEILRQDRATGKKGGGLAILLRRERNITYSEQKLMHLNISTTDVELQLLDIKVGQNKKMIIANCYRPPSGVVNECFNRIENSLDTIDNLEEYEIYINGDFNIAYNLENTSEFKKLKQFERKYNLTQLIKTPTRCTAKSRNILDLMMTNSKIILASGSEELNISDHQPVWLIRKKLPIKPTYVNFKCRCYTNYDKQTYQNELMTYDWTDFYNEHCPNKLWEEMESVILETANKHCPVREYTHKRELPPWLTQDLLDLIHVRDRQYKKAKKTNDNDDWAEARRMRNLCNKGVKNAKNLYIKRELVQHQNDPRKFWQVIEKAWNPNTEKNNHINLIKKDTNEYISLDQIPNTFNNHLCSIAGKLTNRFSDRNIPFMETINRTLDSMSMSPITTTEVYDLVKKIEIHKTSALENISSKLLKDSLEVLSPQLTHLFNSSIFTSIFPDKWKIANVVFIHKGGTRTDINNYRPISLLPTPGKMLEKIVHSRIYTYLDENDLITDSQWGFRPNRSTTIATAKLVEKIFNLLNSKEHVGVLYIDLQKAFDLIDHSLLLNKLSNYGITQPILGWM